MAKKRTKTASKPTASILPSIDEAQELPEKFTPPIATMEVAEADEQAEPELEDATIKTKAKSLKVPLSCLRHGYEQRRCDVQAMTGKQPEMLRRLTNGLIAEEAKLANGRPVKREQDAIKWLLEQLAE